VIKETGELAGTAGRIKLDTLDKNMAEKLLGTTQKLKLKEIEEDKWTPLELQEDIYCITFIKLL
jgi:hypothetical protein